MDSPFVQDRHDFLYLHLPFHVRNLQQGVEHVQVNSYPNRSTGLPACRSSGLPV